MTGRTSDDKGEIDGYFGMFNKEVHASPSSFKKVETPQGRLTTMFVGRDDSGFTWTCVRCGYKYHTNLFDRPLHTCE